MTESRKEWTSVCFEIKNEIGKCFDDSDKNTKIHSVNEIMSEKRASVSEYLYIFESLLTK